MSLVVEVVVIVASILVAFGLEATWSARLERQERATLLAAIRSDVVENRKVIANSLAASHDRSTQARALLRGLAAGESGAARDSLLSTVGSILMLLGWDPINDTYLEAVASGRLSLIDDDEVRHALARYQRRIERVDGIVSSAHAMYYGQMEPFLVANTVYSEIGLEGWRETIGVDDAPFTTDFDQLAASRELWNLVTLRLELEVSWQSYLRRVDGLGEELLTLLPE